MSATSILQATQVCVDALDQACGQNRRLRIVGGASKLGSLAQQDGYTQLLAGELRGVINYEPSELFITALAGTSLKEIETLLAQKGQRLAFDYPRMQGATLGGLVATGAGGSASHSCGRVRDAILGVEMVNGLGKPMRFGGELMKNVAGFDIARLHCGAYGKLGPLVAVTLRLQPQPQRQITYTKPEVDAAKALAEIQAQGNSGNAVIAASWHERTLCVQLEGNAARLKNMHDRYADWQCADNNTGIWETLNKQNFSSHVDQKHLVLHMVCQSSTPIDCLPDALPFCLDRGGELRWYKLPVNQYLQLLKRGVLCRLQARGMALVRYNLPHMPVGNVLPLAKPLATLQQRVFRAFDPHGVCNPDITWYGL